MSSITKRLISNAIEEALRRHGLPPHTAIMRQLESNAEIGGGFQPEVVIREGNSVMTLDQRIRQLRQDPNFCDLFPPPPRSVSHDDDEAIRAEFDAIARGTTIVV
jgi:hypothetical protein